MRDCKADLERTFDMRGHEKADRLFALAWRLGYEVENPSRADVAYHYEELLTLIQGRSTEEP